jgi:UDP-glucuronate decarboxylase
MARSEGRVLIRESLKEDIRHTMRALNREELRKLKGASLLITGACGFLGYYLLSFFQESGRELGITKVVAVDNFMMGVPEWLDDFIDDDLFSVGEFDIISGKINEIKGIEKTDYVVHMASIASPAYYRRHPIETLDANIWGLRNLLDFYKNRELKGLLFFSSSEIYGDPDESHLPTSEDYNGNVSATGPRACYDESKRFGETMCMLFSQKYGMPIGVARPFNNYGPGMKITDKRVPADFAKSVLEGKDIAIFSNGSPTRTFCYISDAAAGYLKILLHGKYDYFNIGIEKPEISVARLAEIYADAGRELSGYKGKITYAVPGDRHYLTDNPNRRCPDISKARSVLSYNPRIEVEEGVRRFLRFILDSERQKYR